jgi:zinc protease
MVKTLLGGALIAALLMSCNPESPRFAFSSTEKRGVIEANGLRFVIMPDPTTKLAEVDVHYDVGSREDPQGRAGLAHLVEHLMFQTRPDGQQTAPIFQTIIDIAVSFNAFTELDATHYFNTVRADDLDAMIKIEAMRMYYAADLPGTKDLPAFGCSTLNESEFERERDVVRNEIRAGSKPEEYVGQLVQAAMYPPGHAYSRETGGNDVQIASASLQDACTFMKNYYAPERATVLIAGNIDVDKTVASIKKWFGSIPKRKALARSTVAPFTAPHKTIEIEADVERPSVIIGWALPAANTKEGEAAAYGIFSTAGRLSAHSSQYDFAYNVGLTRFGGQLAPIWGIEIELKGLDRMDEALDFAKSAAKQAYRGWNEQTWEQLEEEKNRQKAAYIESLEELSARTVQLGYLIQFSKEVDFNSSEQYFFHELDKIEKFDNAAIAGAVKKYFDWDKATIVVIKPNKAGLKGDKRSTVKFKASSAPAGDTALAQASIDPREAKRPIKVSAELKGLSTAKRFTLGNGMDVVLLPVDAMPLVSADLIFKNAGAASSPDNPAIATMAARMLRRVGDMSMEEMEGAEPTDVFSRTGIEVGCRASADSATCSTHGINIYLDVMVRGLERIVKAGEYHQKEIENTQKRIAESWKLKSVQEANEYTRQVLTALYGPNHPYTKASIISPTNVGKVHQDALDTFRRDHYTAGNATLVIAGKFDMKYAEKLVRETFGDWGKGTVDKPVSKEPYKRTGPAYIGVVESKDDQQVNVTVAYPAPAGVDGQEAAREVLSGIMRQRSEDMRFKLGSTYGLYFGRSPRIGPSGYVLHGSGGMPVGGTIDAERGGETLKALRASIDSLRTGDQDFDEQFARARREIVKDLLGQSTVTSELTSRLAFVAEFGLDINYYNTKLQQVAAVAPAQVKALMKSELDPNNEIVVVFGDRAHVEKTFADAGIKDVKIVEPQYK